MEFLVDEEEHPYFIEMNPRIQEEHTVTEMVTGIDIVICQILIAEGYPLNSPTIHIYSQNEIKCTGYALQARVTTEDPANHFLPDTGKIDLYRSGSGGGIRLDGGTAYTGAVITPHYDSLLVKVISHDRTFENAIHKSVRALKELRIHGVKTNITFLINVLNHETFHKGKCFTTFIEETPELFELHYKLDRTTKILEFLANKMVNVNPGPKPFLENRKVPVIDTERKLFGTRDEFLRLGAKEFTQKVYRSDKLYVTDTTMRDGQQSLLAYKRSGRSGKSNESVFKGCLFYRSVGRCNLRYRIPFLKGIPMETTGYFKRTYAKCDDSDAASCFQCCRLQHLSG